MEARPSAPAPAVAAAARSLGPRAVVSLDRLRGGVRSVSRLDGFLTGPSGADPATVALDYVRAQRGLFGSLGSLKLVRRWTGVDGVTHLVWAQQAGGIPAFDNDLRAHVTRDGRLISVGGSARPGLGAAGTRPALGAAAALQAARRSARVAGSGRDRARPTWLGSAQGTRLVWRARVHDRLSEGYDVLVDARTGEVLRRTALALHATGLAWDNRPGAPAGGTQETRDLSPWLRRGDALDGQNAHVLADPDGSGDPRGATEVPPGPDGNWSYGFTPFGQGVCATAVCSWNSRKRRSWRANLAQNATQLFYFLNVFHDHLAAPPIAFDGFSGDDPVIAFATQGANADRGLPPPELTANAGFMPARDGESPTMIFNLFARNESVPFLDVNSGDDGSVVYHEYTHGLSTRLVVDSSGEPALTGQGGAMGEGWSDWYAYDYLVDKGLEPDGATPGELVVGRGLFADGQGIRSEPLDCPVGAGPPACPGAKKTGPGGYTYGDYGRVFDDGPAVHNDGEIWAQTLWDLRARLIADHGPAEGVRRARNLVTRGMELSLPFPSFLDMRNAILQADVVAGRHDRDAIWSVFAARGMGFFAATEIDPEDDQPRENFSVPPDPNGPRAAISGQVVDSLTRDPVRGAIVAVNGLLFNPEGSFVDSSERDGSFTLDLPVGVYPQIQIVKAGFDVAEARDVSIEAGPATEEILLDRDWASRFSGGRVRRQRSEDLCPRAAIIDQDVSGWLTTSPSDRENPGPKSVVIKLRRPIDVRAFGVDPGAACPEIDPDPSASLGRYAIETSRDGRRFRKAKSGRFRARQNFVLNQVRPARAARSRVRYVRLTLRSPQGPAGPADDAPDRQQSFRDYMGLTEFEVYGVPSR